MTRDDRTGEGRDLSRLLHDVAADAARTPRTRDAETMLATARAHGLAARRRRTTARSLVAAASVAVVAVAGVLVTQNLGDAPVVPPPATQVAPRPTPVPGATFPGCGAAASDPEHLTTLRLVTDAVTDADGAPAASSPADARPFIASSTDDLFNVGIANQGDDTVTVGSTGYAAYVLVRDGVVVGTAAGMPEPYREDTIGPDEVSPALSTAGIAMCDGPEAPAAGYYTLYTYVDALLPDPEGADGTLRSTTRIWGGPWDVRIGSTVGGSGTMALECRMPTDEITTPEYPQRDGQPVARAELTPPDSAVTVEPVMSRMARVDVSSLDDETYFGDAVEVYLLRDGEVVSLSSTPAPDGTWYIGAPDSWPDAVADSGAEPVPEGLFPDVSGVDCETGEPLPAGEYEMLVVVPMWVPDYEFQIFAPRERITLGDVPVLPGDDPLAVFPACGAAVPGYSDTPLTLGQPGEEVMDGGTLAELRAVLTNESGKARVTGTLGEELVVVLARDGRVVTRPQATTLSAQERAVDLAPGASTRLTVGYGPRLCDGSDASVPAGAYEIWAQVDLTPAGGETVTSIGRLGNVTYP